MTKVAINAMATGKIPPGDPSWNTFNESFRNMDLDTMDLANEIYTGHSYAPWFNGRRKVENFLLGQHLAVDMDTGDHRSELKTLARHPLVAGYGAILHTTPSHTVEKPRARAIFVLDRPIEDPAAYSAAARFLAQQFDGADLATTDAARFFYGSKDCQIEFLDQRLPLPELRALFARQNRQNGRRRAQGPKPRQHTSPPQNAQGQGVPDRQAGDRVATLDEVAEELRIIPAWGIDYNDWIRILMAIHNGFGDQGLPVAEQWGQGLPGEVAKRFRSFSSDGNPTGTVTPGTIFEIAKRFK